MSDSQTDPQTTPQHLTADDTQATAQLLDRIASFEPGERVERVGRAGQGNMNLTLRVTTDRRSLILKQSRPWVERYPQIEAPVERCDIEAEFYRRVAGVEAVAGAMPRLLGHSQADHAMVLEDLGASADLTDLYAGRPAEPEYIAELGRYLSALHAIALPPDGERLTNRAMRALNHAHQYRIPLEQGNGLDLDAIEAGLNAAAAQAIHDKPYIDAVCALGQRYLADGDYLLHGDFFPGSWLRHGDGLRIIDPEFAFHGDREYDLGVAVAHLVLARQPDAAHALLAAYHHPTPLDTELLSQYASAEVMRRLIGYAQLPLALRAPQRAELLSRAVCAMKAQRWEQLLA